MQTSTYGANAYSTDGTLGQTIDAQTGAGEMTHNGQMAVDGVLGITMSRRRALRLLGAAGAATMVAGVAQVIPAHAT